MISSASNLGLAGVIVDAPMLFESGFDKECNYLIAVTAPVDMRVKRIKERDGITETKALERIRHQIPDEELVKRVDFIIDNSCSIEEVESAVLDIVNKINNN